MSLIDEFENSFQACLAPITNPVSSHVFDNDELKANSDNIARFLEISQQIESLFIQKRAILFSQKPETVLNEEINELRNELLRKEHLLNRYHEKLNKWSNVLNEALSGKIIQSNIKMEMSSQMSQMRMPQPQSNQVQTSANSPMMQHVHSPAQMMRNPNVTGMVSQIQPINQFTSHQVANPPVQNQGGLQGHLAYLERTTKHIGDNRR